MQLKKIKAITVKVLEDPSLTPEVLLLINCPP
jgi:hypothetical protein